MHHAKPITWALVCTCGAATTPLTGSSPKPITFWQGLWCCAQPPWKFKTTRPLALGSVPFSHSMCIHYTHPSNSSCAFDHTIQLIAWPAPSKTHFAHTLNLKKISLLANKLLRHCAPLSTWYQQTNRWQPPLKIPLRVPLSAPLTTVDKSKAKTLHSNPTQIPKNKPLKI